MHSLFLRSDSASWSDLSVPAGSHFGINRDGPAPGRWHSGLTYEYDASKDFNLRPVGRGKLHCDFRPGTLHFEVPNIELMGTNKIGRAFLDPLVLANYSAIPLLPFPTVQSEREALSHAIEQLDGSIKLILSLDPTAQIKLGEELGTVHYVMYDSVDIRSLYDAFLGGLASQPFEKKGAQGPLRGAWQIGKTFKSKLSVPFTWDHIFRLFLLGLVTADVAPDTVPTLGKPGMGPNAGKRRISLWAFSEHGAVDPVTVFRHMSDINTLDDNGTTTSTTTFFSAPAPTGNGAVEPTFVWDSAGASVEDRNVLRSVSDPLTITKAALLPAPAANGTISNTDAALAARFLYPLPMLNMCCTRLNLTPAEWRAVGYGQKALFGNRLPAAGAANEAALLRSYFDWNDRYNIFQLEAAVEHFCLGTKSSAGATSDDPTRVYLQDEVVSKLTVNFLQAAPLGWSANPHTSSLYLAHIDWMADLGGPRTALEISTGKAGDRASDEYEGVIFIVAPRPFRDPFACNGARVRHIAVGFASFTGKRPESKADGGLPGAENASSIEGNRKYLFQSVSSGGHKGHNYTFLLYRDRGIGPKLSGKLPGWFYWGSDSPARDPGVADNVGSGAYKGAILMHRGNPVLRNGEPPTGGWNGSHGCQVAPITTYHPFRAAVCEVWLDEHADDEPKPDAYSRIRKITSLTPAEIELLWSDTDDHEKAELFWEEQIAGMGYVMASEWALRIDAEIAQIQTEREDMRLALRSVPAEYWNAKIEGTYYLIRPLEQDAGSGKRMIRRPQ